MSVARRVVREVAPAESSSGGLGKSAALLGPDLGLRYPSAPNQATLPLDHYYLVRGLVAQQGLV